MKHLLIILSLFTLSCSYDEFPQWSGGSENSKVPNAFIETLVYLATDTPSQIMSSHIIKGTVISSDKAGNFYKSVFIDDGSAALELMVGLYNMDNLYPEGSSLVVSCEGLFMAKSSGITQLGLDAGSSIGYFSHQYIASSYISVSDYNQELPLLSVSIDNLSDDYLGRLIKLSNICYNDDDTLWTSFSSWTGYYIDSYRSFEDRNGNTIKVLTSSYAEFADEQIPVGEIDLCGILFYDSAEGYYVKIRSLSDLTLH